ncbi:nucleotidyltransferase domain-containing protein [Phyllobacterium leguminum]|uniref:Nucleotidyltransferase n=1 Tax=Phyllobacterium leguminum TaxID=314237 RepID=A0A318T4C1_9HYPH|nr:nucleotidyltransferase domain-containing protein [Phyllobacterium leguminum]PYE88941.1 hypothetical protein C7477_10540 [Phyllobacterium leguminum]
MRALPDNFDSEAVDETYRRLEGVSRDERVIIPLAVESGSRAWGFPSPDSDYDCRFVYVRPVEDSFTLFPKRDVIETPLTPIIDVNGWELSKALKLLLTGNAVIVEWLTSPIVYQAHEEFRSAFLALANVGNRDGFARHYYYMARSQFQRFASDEEDQALKKVFYSLRPLMALRWLRVHADEKIAPMHFPTLCETADLPGDLKSCIHDLLARKAETRELGKGRVPTPIMSFLKSEFALAEQGLTRSERNALEVEAAKEQLDIFWRYWINTLWDKSNAIL